LIENQLKQILSFMIVSVQKWAATITASGSVANVQLDSSFQGSKKAVHSLLSNAFTEPSFPERVLFKAKGMDPLATLPANGRSDEAECGGYPTRASRPTKRSKGSTPKERTGESRDKGLNTNANPKTSETGERSWKLARCGRFRANGVRVCHQGHPLLNLGRNFFPPRRFSYHTRFSGFNGTVMGIRPEMTERRLSIG
jgi:hypothetical protein